MAYFPTTRRLAMRILRWLWANRYTWSKVIGIGFLIAYFCDHAFHIDWFWVAVALGLCVGIAFYFVCVVDPFVKRFLVAPIVERFLPENTFNPPCYVDNLTNVIKRAPFREFVLIPGEDGLFFVPLLWIGITPVTAAITAALFAAVHYPLFSINECKTKFVFILCIAVWVLPHGLGSVIVAHLICDAIVFAILLSIGSDTTASRTASATIDRTVVAREVDAPTHDSIGNNRPP